ncbi:MAG: glycosyltransferase family 9 protein [Alphaproteobacteria bacterium]|nr:glycosyltransferase family 9 protein [Alphaproteobacteria bacterium]
MNILFISHTRIGDAVLSSGLLAHLVERYPEARITLACGALPAPLFAATPGLRRLVPMRKQRLNGHWLKLWTETVGTYWDLLVDLRNSALSRAVSTGERHILRPVREPLHRVRHLARLLGLEPPPAPRLWLGEAARARARELVPEGEPILALGPTANWPGKAWPADRFATLAERLTVAEGILPGARVAVLGAGEERRVALPVIESIPEARRLDLVGAVKLATAAACLARAALYVGNDSGLMHIAAAVGTPTLGLFGPSREALYAPWGEKAAWVRGARSYEEIAADPAFDPGGTGPWMADLDVDAVEAAAAALWRRVGEG